MARVLPSGLVEFATRYRIHGRRRRLKLGTFPGVTLKQARVLARKARGAVDADHDPVAERRAAKAIPTDTVAALAEDYLKRHARRFKRTAAEDERVLNVEVLPAWKDRSVSQLTRRDVRALLERIVDRGSPVMANRVFALVRKMLNFAVDHDWIEANPAARIKKPTPEVSRERVLTDEELRRLWSVLSRFPTTAERAAPGRKRAKGHEGRPALPCQPGPRRAAQECAS